MVRRRSVLGAATVLVSVAACGGDDTRDVGPVATDDAVTVVEDVPYATWKAHTLTLDVYEPATGDGTIVVHLVSINGGTPEFYPRELAAEGATVFVVDYPRMGVAKALADGGAGVRAMADSTACALHFARDDAADSDEAAVVALTGYSLGGGVAAHAALFGADLEDRWNEFQRTRGGPPSEVECTIAEGSTDVDVFVGFAGTYDAFVPVYDSKWGRTYQQERDPDLWEHLSSSIGSNQDLTVRLVHGEADTVVPHEVTTLFATPLGDAGHDVEVVSYTGGHDMPEDVAVPTVMDAINGQDNRDR